MGTEDPVKIAQAAVRHARDYGNDYVIIDTAGRLQIDEALMNELKNIKEAVNPTGHSARGGRHDRPGGRERQVV